MKKYFSIILVLFLSLTLLNGCGAYKNEKQRDSSNIDFKSDKAKEVSDKYLDLLCEGKINEANDLLTDDLKQESKSKSLGDTSIVSYKIDKIVESADNSAIVYDVIRVKTDSVRADRDTITIRVILENEEYKISEVKSSNKNQVYSKGDKLRFMGEEGGDSQLILDINNLHIDIYPKNQGAMIEKAKIPHDAFGVVSISYSGKRIGLTTTNGTDNFIAVVDIDEGLVAQAPSEGESSGNTKENPKDEKTEKSIAKKIIPLDILKVQKIDKLIFSSDEEKIIIQYVENGKSRLKIYTSAGGEIVENKLDDEFPSDQYSIEFVGLEKKMIKAKVKGNNTEKLYTLDLESNEIKEK